MHFPIWAVPLGPHMPLPVGGATPLAPLHTHHHRHYHTTITMHTCPGGQVGRRPTWLGLPGQPLPQRFVTPDCRYPHTRRIALFAAGQVGHGLPVPNTDTQAHPTWHYAARPTFHLFSPPHGFPPHPQETLHACPLPSCATHSPFWAGPTHLTNAPSAAILWVTCNSALPVLLFLLFLYLPYPTAPPVPPHKTPHSMPTHTFLPCHHTCPWDLPTQAFPTLDLHPFSPHSTFPLATTLRAELFLWANRFAILWAEFRTTAG